MYQLQFFLEGAVYEVLYTNSTLHPRGTEEPLRATPLWRASCSFHPPDQPLWIAVQVQQTLCPTSTTDLRAAHVPLNIAKGRRRLHRAKPSALFIIFLCDLWPTGRGRTCALKAAELCFDCCLWKKRKKNCWGAKCLSLGHKHYNCTSWRKKLWLLSLCPYILTNSFIKSAKTLTYYSI